MLACAMIDRGSEFIRMNSDGHAADVVADRRTSPRLAETRAVTHATSMERAAQQAMPPTKSP